MRLHYLVKFKIRVFMTILMLFIDLTEINISDHELGKHYLHMIAELNKMVFSAASYLRQDWAEAQRGRQGRRSVAPKAENARSR